MIQLHQFNLEESVKLLQLDDSQLALLKEFKPILERDVDEIIQQFYAHITKVPKLRGIIDQFSTLERLAVTLKKYLLSIFPDKIDEEYIMGRVKIGNVHNRQSKHFV